MTAEADFTEEEWRLVRDAPWTVALGVVEADPGGPFRTGHELSVVTRRVEETDEHGSEHDLVRAVAADLVADRAERPAPSAGRRGDANAKELRDRALEACALLADLLDANVPAAEAAGYKAWLLDIAGEVAEADERVRDSEREMLTELAAALRVEGVAA